MSIDDGRLRRYPGQYAEEKPGHGRWTMRGLFNVVGEGLVISDGETGEILAANRRMAEMFGYTEAELKELGFAGIRSRQGWKKFWPISERQ